MIEYIAIGIGIFIGHLFSWFDKKPVNVLGFDMAGLIITILFSLIITGFIYLSGVGLFLTSASFLFLLFLLGKLFGLNQNTCLGL